MATWPTLTLKLIAFVWCAFLQRAEVIPTDEDRPRRTSKTRSEQFTGEPRRANYYSSQWCSEHGAPSFPCSSHWRIHCSFLHSGLQTSRALLWAPVHKRYVSSSASWICTHNIFWTVVAYREGFVSRLLNLEEQVSGLLVCIGSCQTSPGIKRNNRLDWRVYVCKIQSIVFNLSLESRNITITCPKCKLLTVI